MAGRLGIAKIFLSDLFTQSLDYGRRRRQPGISQFEMVYVVTLGSYCLSAFEDGKHFLPNESLRPIREPWRWVRLNNLAVCFHLTLLNPQIKKKNFRSF